jgi:hypothetical protein
MTYLPYSLANELVADHRRELEGSAARWRLRRRRTAEPLVEGRVLREVPPQIATKVGEPADESPAAAA